MSKSIYGALKGNEMNLSGVYDAKMNPFAAVIGLFNPESVNRYFNKRFFNSTDWSLNQATLASEVGREKAEQIMDGIYKIVLNDSASGNCVHTSKITNMDAGAGFDAFQPEIADRKKAMELGVPLFEVSGYGSGGFTITRRLPSESK